MNTDHGNRAVSHLVDHEWLAAGDEYTLGSFVTLSERDGGRATFDPEGRTTVGYAVRSQLVGALCYRLAGADRRGRTRCKQAILVLEEQRDDVRDHPLERAVCDELIGDAYAVAGATAAADAYDRAAETYREHAPEDAMEWVRHPLFDAATSLLLHVSRNTGGETTWDQVHGADPNDAGYLAHRPRFKHQRFPSVVRAVLDSGVLHPPRGSTEHNNDGYRCPACETSEVNWVGEEVVCIDCSTRMERVD